MDFLNLCAPALLYVMFSLVHIIIDTFKGMYNTAFMKFIVMIMITILLNILCERGLTVISWIIVFIPFILMTIVVSMLLYIFGLNASTGTLNYDCKDGDAVETTEVPIATKDVNGNIIVYDPDYDAANRPVYYRAPNIIIPPANEMKPPPTNNLLNSYNNFGI